MRTVPLTHQRVTIQDDFDLDKILESGQCFRPRKLADGRCRFVSGKALLYLTPLGCGQYDAAWYGADWDVWAGYFDLGRSYAALRQSLAGQSAYLDAALAFGQGIRVLRQDRWEALCSFIISQNNNIKRIKGIIERLCRLLGQSIGDSGFFSFPTPEALAAATADQLAPLRCGFRARYLIDAAQKVCSGQVRLDAIPSMPLEEAHRELMQICGVGPKVADCVLLFGFHRLECCPMDVWMKRVFAVLYPNGLPDCARDFAGIAQQYLFHYARTCPQAFDPEEVSA